MSGKIIFMPVFIRIYLTYLVKLEINLKKRNENYEIVKATVFKTVDVIANMTQEDELSLISNKYNIISNIKR